MLEHTRHNYLVGQAAEKLAAQYGLELVDNSFFDTESRRAQLEVLIVIDSLPQVS